MYDKVGKITIQPYGKTCPTEENDTMKNKVNNIVLINQQL